MGNYVPIGIIINYPFFSIIDYENIGGDIKLDKTPAEKIQVREKRFVGSPIDENKYIMEVLVVVDKTMQAYYGSNLEEHVLQLMSIVSNLFSDASIGNDIGIAVLDILRLTDEIKVTPHQYVGKFLFFFLIGRNMMFPKSHLIKFLLRTGKKSIVSCLRNRPKIEFFTNK